MANYEMVAKPIFGPPIDNPQFPRDVFMIMPFAKKMQPIYEDVKSIVESLGLQILRGDDFYTQHSIMAEIWSAINYAKLIIADCTGKNANVFYELGIAHTLGKPTILLAQDETKLLIQDEADMPFDVRHLRYIVYTRTPSGMRKLKRELGDAISTVLGLPASSDSAPSK
jgi:hypothetical protein